MIKALKKRARPDNLVNQVRANGKSTARRIYLLSISAATSFIVFQFLGPLFFLDSDGMVMRDVQIIAADYTGKIAQVHVKPGDKVIAGTVVANVQSNDIVDKLSELTIKIASLSSRQSQIEGRLRSLDIIEPSVAERLDRALQARTQVQELLKRKLTTSLRVGEVAREVFEAEKEKTYIGAERVTLQQELGGIRQSHEELLHLRNTIKSSYANGRLSTVTDGTVGARVLAPGVVVRRGETIADIHHGDAYVRAFVQSGRLYSLSSGDRVVVSDGITRRWGEIERLETVSDQLPQEFQSSLKSVSRQQLMRIRLIDGNAPFPIPSQVKVMGHLSPYAVAALVKGTLLTAEGRRSAVKTVMAGLGFEAQPHGSQVDMSGVASTAKRRHAEPAFSPAPGDGPGDWRTLTDDGPTKSWNMFE